MNWRPTVRQSLPYMVGAGAGFVVGFLLIYLFVFPSSRVPDDAAVPGVTGLYQEDAMRRLRMAGFEGATGEERYHSSAPAGTVLEQDPASGAMQPRGTKVTLSLSKGQQEAQVPAVLGLSRSQAQAALQKAGFEVGDVRPRSSNQPRGEVIASDPVAGSTQPVPSAVNLTVSSGPSTLDMPDLVGQSYPQARLFLEQLGLTPEPPVYDSTSLMPEFTILSQSPLPGEEVGPGTTITLWIAGRAP